MVTYKEKKKNQTLTTFVQIENDEINSDYYFLFAFPAFYGTKSRATQGKIYDRW